MSRKIRRSIESRLYDLDGMPRMTIEEFNEKLREKRQERQEDITQEFNCIANTINRKDKLSPDWALDEIQFHGKTLRDNLDQAKRTIGLGDHQPTLVNDTRHDPETTLKKNAQSILVSSRNDPTYGSAIVQAMEWAYENGEYDSVLEIALSVDVLKRPITRLGRLSQEEEMQTYRQITDSQNFTKYLFDEILAHCDLDELDELDEPILPTVAPRNIYRIYNLCDNALKTIEGDMSQDKIAETKAHLKDALAEIEKFLESIKGED